MTSITAEDLQAFASANGLKVMDHRDAVDWAKNLNRNNGLCPCGKVCPCNDCTCKFYESIGEEPEEPDMVIKNEEIARAVETLEDAKGLLLSIDTTTTMKEAIETIDAAKELVEKDAEAHKCNECEKYMRSYVRKLDFAKSECEKDPLACTLERNDALHRAELMQQTFIGADADLTRMEEEQKAAQTRETDEKTENTETALDVQNNEVEKPYRECVRDTMANIVDEIPSRQVRMCVSTKMCGKTTPKTKEEAMAECLKSQEERENGQNSN
jgi:hypothetical protein